MRALPRTLACFVAFAWAESAGAQQPPGEKLPAAWIGRQPGSMATRGLIDLRSFYHYVDGTGARRPDWSGAELLSYLDVHDGLSGAFVVRHEQRDETGNYGTVMLLPRVAKETYVVSSVGIGDGARFMPVTRLDLQVRGFFPFWKQNMYDVGGYSTWWTQRRRQLAQSDALILWYNPHVVEIRYGSLFTRADAGSWRFNFQSSVVYLYGEQGKSWLMLRLQLGTEPENVPGRAFADTRDLLALNATVGYRHWITEHYGLAGEVEGFHQVFTWSRFGTTLAMFASF
jgi:YaiO family outer membrane protein